MKININKKQVHLTDILIDCKKHIKDIDVCYDERVQHGTDKEIRTYILNESQKKKVLKANLTILFLNSQLSYDPPEIEADSIVLEILLENDNHTFCSFASQYVQVYFRIKPALHLNKKVYKWLFIDQTMLL